ncbi:chromate transporter, partial [Stutzerimonas stutzeri]|nr:chromate transporter [Stutzerimonas stutzeri]
MLAAASAVLLLPFVWSQVAIIVVAGLIGLLAFRPASGEVHPDLPVRIKMRTALSALAAADAGQHGKQDQQGKERSQALAQ